MPVPLLDLTRQYEPLREDFRQAIDRVCDSQRFILGDEVADFEREAAEILGVAHAVGVTSGTDALLEALEVQVRLVRKEQGRALKVTCAFDVEGAVLEIETPSS